MADIIHEFTVKAVPARVFEAMATPAGLDRWWTQTSSGEPRAGSEFRLGFGPGYDWVGQVGRCEPPSSFELQITQADEDWLGTRVGFELRPDGQGTRVRFHHTGWPSQNEHWRLSCFCWAMYLRIMRRYVEYGENVPFGQRLQV